MINDLETISFEIVHTNPGKPLGFEIWFDQVCLAQHNKLIDNLKFEHQFPNNPGPHQLKLIVKNKMPWHTVLDSHQQIIQDTALLIQNFRMNDILMIDTFCMQAQYTCQELGTVALIDCFAYLGFNGHLVFDFESPLDQWALEHYV